MYSNSAAVRISASQKLPLSSILSASVKLPLVGRQQHLQVSQQARLTGIPKPNVPSDVLPGCTSFSIGGEDPLPSSAKVNAS
jgi:hypothetical protein